MFKRLRLYAYCLKDILRTNKGLLIGMWKLTRIRQPAITIFGGSRLPKENSYSRIITHLAEKLAHNGFSIITGGGPGIMEAANLGAWENATAHKTSTIRSHDITNIGIGLTNLQKENSYLQDYIIQPYFFARKWLLVRYASGFIVGPGGFGTLDELMEVVTLLQTHKMQKTPIVLIGKTYWQGLLDWIDAQPVTAGLIIPEHRNLLHLTDSVEEAFSFINSECSSCTSPQSAIKSKIKDTL